MLPGAIVMGLMSPVTGRLFDKYGARVWRLLVLPSQLFQHTI